MSNVIYDVREYVAHVTINRPDRLNAVDRATETELEAVWADIEQNDDVRVVVLTGAGDRAFCTGADMKGSAGLTGLEYWATCSPNGFGGVKGDQKRGCKSPIIQRVGQLLIGDPGVLDGICRVGVAELPLNRGDIAGFLDEVPAHGMAGGMGSVTFYAGEAAHVVEHRIDHPGVETSIAVGIGD